MLNLKGKFVLMVINRYTKLKYKFENRYFRIEKYYVSIEEGKIQYIQGREKDDIM